MKTLTVLLCQNQSAWDHVIQSIPCLCWGLIAVVAIYLFLRYLAKPLIANCHERQMKKEDFEREKFWAFFKKYEEPTELNECKEELNNLKKEDEKRKDERSKLDEEIKNFKETILNEKVKIYEEIIKCIGPCKH